VKMIRRGSGRTPPFILVGLVLIVLILGFNYWTLSSQNADLQQEVEKLQAELKISAMKQEQSETKNAALQETVHEMDSISANLKKKLEEEKDVLKSKDHDNQKKEYEITSLKNKLVKLQEHIDTITQQLEDHEAELSKAKETNIHLATERDDAVEAIAEKDALINTLKRQLEQEKSRSSALQYSVDSLKKKVTQTFGELTACQDKFSDIETLAKSLKAKEQKAQDEIAAAEHEKLAIVQPKIVPGPMNLPSVEYKALSQNGANIGHDNAAVDTLVAPQPINHGNSNDVNLHVDQGNPQIQAPGPAVVEQPAVKNRPVIEPMIPGNVDGQDPQKDVLAPPPQHQEDNLDAAIDEEGKIVEDLMDDQDEEGNDIKHNNGNMHEDNGREDNKDLPRSGNQIGALEVPHPFLPQEDTHQDMNIGEDLGNQGNYYENNLDNNIRNLQRPEFH
ncbi:hypothetical protein OTU49_001815, partial [Cherax quadricarinatus]